MAWKRAIFFAFAAMMLQGQTTQSLISGRLVNSVTGRPVSGALVTYISGTSTAFGSSLSDADGYYALPLLSPGMYRVRATAANYQAQEAQELELVVASRLDLSFRLRPLNDVWEAGALNSVFLPGSRTIVTFFGPDVDATRTGSFEANKGRRAPLETTVSQVISSSDIADLPLAGRDVYTMLVTQPGVTSDGATARGLGLAANGQRPSASNFLLDGLENNNYLITGPLVPVAPQAIQEYRVSTNNYTAEYGRTSGFVANSITRSGANQFHGTAYLYLKNEALNANGFQENAAGIERTPYKETQPGFWVGGPIRRDRLFFSSAFEHFRSRSPLAPRSFRFPNVPVLANNAIEGSRGLALLQQYAPPEVTGPAATGFASIAQPVSLNRAFTIQRVDWNPGVNDRVTGTFLLNRLTRPDFIWTPYPDFVSALHQNTYRGSATYTRTFSPTLINDARAAYSDDDLYWDRPHPEIPTLVSADGAILPGSPAFYEYKNNNRSLELLDNVMWTRGAHRFAFGGGVLTRASDGYLTAGRDAQYGFQNAAFFVLDRPSQFRASIQRSTLPNLQQPDSNREYRYNQGFFFAQDTFRASERLTVNFGLRYELFGAPRNVGAVKDALVQLGPGERLQDRLTAAGAPVIPGRGNQRIFGTDKGNWAVRAGASYDLLGNGRTLLRASYGIFYDRPFDNLWQNSRNNDFILPQLTLSGTVNFLAPVQNTLDTFSGRVLNADFPPVTLVDPDLKNGRVHSYFAGVQQQLASNLTLEVNALGSYGRGLITTDIVNRSFSTTQGRFNSRFPDVAFRSNQGFSDYNAMTAVLRYRAGRGTLHVAYTWSHWIDNQSEPLAGDFFNLTFTSITAGDSNGRAAFSRQFDSLADRGNSDFDQRHNLVLYYTWYVPGLQGRGVFGFLTRDWLVAGLGAVRSGFPYSLLTSTEAVSGQGFVLNNRPNLLNPLIAEFPNPPEVAGGVRLLNAAAFGTPAASTLGNLGRNALTGPGFYNVDFSLARNFRVAALGEGGSVQLRADVFNVLNHANLGNPSTLLTVSDFGIARYGRSGRSNGFPAVSPLQETARQLQMSVQVRF